MVETTQPVQPIKPQNVVAGIVKKFPKINFAKVWPFILGGVLVVGVGVTAGFVLSGHRFSSSNVAPGGQSNSKVAGINDEKTFKDTATGVLAEGGIQGEGQYHLTREGGDSQNVYLTSTAVDLKPFLGKKVQVWGQTIAARTAGWLMDVGKVQVVQ